MADPATDAARPSPGAVAFSALAVSTVVIFYLGILPTRIIDLAASSVGTIF
jgi:hypothetical protein